MKKSSSTDNDSFLIEYTRLAEVAETTVRVFRWSPEKHTVHGEHAVQLADSYFAGQNLLREITSSATSSIRQRHPLPTLDVPKSSVIGLFDFVLNKMAIRLQIWERDKQIDTWSCTKEASPGNTLSLTEYLSEYGDWDPPEKKIIAVSFPKTLPSQKANGQIVCVCVIDLANLIFEIGVVNEPSNELIKLQGILLATQPAEVWLINNTSTSKRDELCRFAKSSNKCLVLDISVKLPASSFDANDITGLGIFSRHSMGILQYPENDLVLSTVVLPVINHLKKNSKIALDHQFVAKPLSRTDHMRLNGSAIRAMGLFNPADTDPADQSNGRSDDISSLFDLLNHCLTRKGRELLRLWITNPLLSIDEILKRQEMVNYFVRNVELRAELQRYLRCVPDLSGILRRLLCGLEVNLEMCYKVYVFATTISTVIKPLEAATAEQNETDLSLLAKGFVRPIQASLFEFEDFTDRVQSTIDFDRLNSDRVFVVKSTISDVLADAADTLNDVKLRVVEIREKVCGQIKSNAVRYDCSGRIGYFLRLPHKDQYLLKGISDRFSILEVRKDGVKFSNQEIDKLNEEYSEAQEQFNRAAQSVVKDLTAMLVKVLPHLRLIEARVSELDVLIAFADVAGNARFPYCRPRLLPSSSKVLNLVASRHPWMERQSQSDFIANDVRFDQDRRRFCILTGPNMGGKSTYIRQIGLNIILAQIGAFVPCDKAEMSIFSGLFARFGASDNIARGQSTLLLEMTEASYLLKAADEHSFLMIDELGRGTSSRDGFSIAWAVVRYLSSRVKCSGAFATHYHQLAGFVDSQPLYNGLFNLHVKAELQGNCFIPLYKVEEGPTQESHGIAIAKALDFPSDIIEEAEKELAGIKSDDWMGAVDNPQHEMAISDYISYGLTNLIGRCEKEDAVTTIKDEVQEFLKGTVALCDKLNECSFKEKVLSAVEDDEFWQL